MARRAVWRARKEELRTPLGWALGDDSVRWLPLPVAFASMIVAGAVAVAWSPWALLLVPTIALHVRRPSVAKDLRELGTVPPPGPEFAVHLDVFQDQPRFERGILLGADDGMVTFVDGWLHFAGRRTEFSLRRDDLVSCERWRADVRLRLRNAGTISLRALNDEEGEVLARAMAVWYETTPSPKGESILPPCEIHPLGLARAWRDAVTTTVGFAVGAFIFVRWLGAGGIFVFLPTSAGVYRRLARARSTRRALL